MIRHETALLASIMLAGIGLLAAQESKRFVPPPSAGRAIQDASKNAVLDRVAEDSNPPATDARPRTEVADPQFGVLRSLTNTDGVDFTTFMRDLYSTVRLKWYARLPTVEYARYAHANLEIEFTVLKDGSVTGMKLVESSGDDALNRMAWEGIAAAAPFDAFPAKFKSDSLRLRFRFFYNPNAADIRYAHRSGMHPPM